MAPNVGAACGVFVTRLCQFDDFVRIPKLAYAGAPQRASRGLKVVVESRSMHIGILRTDSVRPEWVPTFGEYPDMFERLLLAEDSALTFTTWNVEAGELPDSVEAADSDGEACVYAGAYLDQQQSKQRSKAKPHSASCTTQERPKHTPLVHQEAIESNAPSPHAHPDSLHSRSARLCEHLV